MALQLAGSNVYVLRRAASNSRTDLPAPSWRGARHSRVSRCGDCHPSGPLLDFWLLAHVSSRLASIHPYSSFLALFNAHSVPGRRMARQVAAWLQVAVIVCATLLEEPMNAGDWRQAQWTLSVCHPQPCVLWLGFGALGCLRLLPCI